MVRRLKRKFIRAAMIAVTLVMVIFLIAINLLNRYTAERDAAKTLQIILAGETPEEPGGRNPGMEMPAMRGEKPGEVSGAEMPDFPEANSMAEPPVKPSGEEASENAGEEPPVKPETEAGEVSAPEWARTLPARSMTQTSAPEE